MDFLILDLATCPIDNAASFIDSEDISAPDNYKDPVKIAAYIAGKKAERLEKAALDIDLARITVVGWQRGAESSYNVHADVCRNEDVERERLMGLRSYINQGASLVTFNGLRFDWPLLMRRALYLDVDFPTINCDRYRTRHIDLWDHLSNHGAISAHALTWYVKRFGWTDLVKPLSGAEEAAAVKNGQWELLEASVRHDVLAVGRLAEKLHLIPQTMQEPVL